MRSLNDRAAIFSRERARGTRRVTNLTPGERGELSIGHARAWEKKEEERVKRHSRQIGRDVAQGFIFLLQHFRGASSHSSTHRGQRARRDRSIAAGGERGGGTTHANGTRVRASIDSARSVRTAGTQRRQLNGERGREARGTDREIRATPIDRIRTRGRMAYQRD